MNIREANITDLDSIGDIYNDIHLEEENGGQTIGWMRGVYPTRRTAEEAILRGDMFVLEDGKVLGAGIINQTQVDVYYGAPWEHDMDLVCVLHTLVISPDAAGRGYGRAFVEFLCLLDRLRKAIQNPPFGRVRPFGARPVRFRIT